MLVQLRLVPPFKLFLLLWESADHSEQGQSTTSSYARSIRFPRPYHHLTSKFKLYPISHLKHTRTYTGQLTLPPRIYCPNFSLYMSFWTEHCWRKLCPIDARRTLIQCCNSSFFKIIFLVLIDKPWRPVRLHITIVCLIVFPFDCFPLWNVFNKRNISTKRIPFIY